MEILRQNERYLKLYEEMLVEFGKASKRSNASFSVFVPHIGPDFARTGVLIYGRAGNGGDHGAKSEYLTRSAKDHLRAAVSRVRFDWQDSFKNSAFLNASREIVQRISGGDEKDWASNYGWSNLFRISPKKGGNPGLRQQTLQRSLCTELFLSEIELLQPRIVILMTGLDWSDEFLTALGIDTSTTGLKGHSKYVKAMYILNGMKIVVTARPEKKRRELFVESVLRHLE